MPRHTSYLVREVLHDLEHGRVTRRHALRALAGMLGAAAATQVVSACAGAPHAPRSTTRDADRVAADDPQVTASAVVFRDAQSVALRGYLARPARQGTYPVVLVCHAIRGLTPHIEDVTRRLARAGYLAIAVDLISRAGGTDHHAPDEIAGLLGSAPDDQAGSDFAAALAFARSQPTAHPTRAGMIGFCLGGGITWDVAVREPSLAAAVAFYGSPASAEDIPQIHAAMLGLYAADDEIIPPAKVVPPTEAGMRAAGKTFHAIVYPGVDHAFYDDTGSSFDATAARAAWRETLAWLARYLA